MLCNRFYTYFLVAVFLLSAAPGESRAMELGLTPSHVFSLWTNINHSLLDYAETLSDDEAWLAHLSDMPAERFSGKTPSDVFAKAQKLHARLNLLMPITLDLPKWLKSFNPTSQQFTKAEEATPSEVFLLSTLILNGLVDELVELEGHEPTVSIYYKQYGFTGKTPSDVFGLVDLATLRVEQILSKAKASRGSAS